jgi:3-hydroxyacyl-CoA dehydrogenase
VLRWDWRGSGLSEKIRGDLSIDTMCGDLAALLDGLGFPQPVNLVGTALGGGFEVALGSHYRIALSDARVGLPEIHLGLIPGAGGTQRVPRLCGAEMALDIMFKGTTISAQTAHAAGLIDRFVEADLLDAALTYASQLTQVRRTRDETRGLTDEPAYRAALAAAEKPMIAQHWESTRKLRKHLNFISFFSSRVCICMLFRLFISEHIALICLPYFGPSFL